MDFKLSLLLFSFIWLVMSFAVDDPVYCMTANINCNLFIAGYWVVRALEGKDGRR